MSDTTSNEVWQVDVNGRVYEAPFSELADWIAEGSLLAEDKVRRGNLRWIEARKVLTLVPFFNARAAGSPMPPVVSTTEFRTAAITKGFGFGDFGEALAYPFKFKISLFFGALMYMFFSVGKLGAAMGGMYMIAAAIFAYMLANMLTFGILANTVDNFA